ncbi:hypothetical protein cyc_01271 [Cyclospora cayetanensis]|uniref:Uncharacterized protein n=1 Tax=Cyclospora cayetanensis TaxID=88456 RepID=A0A1D3D101_9EIME|nr:hypothetical protein cyc_01271 [Cyclospora cayetanensis]
MTLPPIPIFKGRPELLAAIRRKALASILQWQEEMKQQLQQQLQNCQESVKARAASECDSLATTSFSPSSFQKRDSSSPFAKPPSGLERQTLSAGADTASKVPSLADSNNGSGRERAEQNEIGKKASRRESREASMQGVFASQQKQPHAEGPPITTTPSKGSKRAPSLSIDIHIKETLNYQLKGGESSEGSQQETSVADSQERLPCLSLSMRLPDCLRSAASTDADAIAACGTATAVVNAASTDADAIAACATATAVAKAASTDADAIAACATATAVANAASTDADAIAACATATAVANAASTDADADAIAAVTAACATATAVAKAASTDADADASAAVSAACATATAVVARPHSHCDLFPRAVFFVGSGVCAEMPFALLPLQPARAPGGC